LNKKRLQSLVGFAVVTSVCYLIINRLSSSWSKIQDQANLGLTGWSVLSVLLLCAAVATSGLLWGRVLNMLSRSVVGSSSVVGNKEAIRVHTGAWLLKYIPGQIGSVVYKIDWGRKKGFRKIDVALSFVYENLFLTIVSLLPTSIILILFGGLNASTNALLGLILLGSLVFVFSRPFLRFFINLLAKKAKINPKKIELINYKKVLKISCYYVLPRLLNGLGFVAVCASLFSIGVGDIAPLIAVYTLAGIIGIYAIFVPSGLGVREAMIILFGAGILGVDQAILAAVVIRFYATITDGFLALFYGYSTRLVRRRKTNEV